MSAVRLCGDRIFARSWGSEDAPILLCWHSAGGSSADYATIAPPLTDRLGVRIVAIDAPGHAQSPAPRAEAFRPTALAALAAEILDALRVERAAFLGLSWGATVGCWCAALHPERTSALVLVEGGHVDFTDLPGFPTDLALEDLVAEARAEAKRRGAAFGSHSPEVAGAMIHGLCAEPASAAYSRLAAAGTPTLFIGAGPGAGSDAVERLTRLVPQCEVVHLEATGHDLLLEAPSDVVRAVGDWLA